LADNKVSEINNIKKTKQDHMSGPANRGLNQSITYPYV
jgi:hypothetical protein